MSTPGAELRPQLQELRRKLSLHAVAWQAAEEAEGTAWARLIGHTPALFDLAVRMQLDERVPRDERERLLAALLYLAAPGDLAPEKVLGTSGYRDDLLVLALALARTGGRLPSLVAELWSGESDGRDVIGQIISRGAEIAGPTLWPRIMTWIDR
jgi:uncharacterized membrane protein YkvA (DUF1232 family)